MHSERAGQSQGREEAGGENGDSGGVHVCLWESKASGVILCKSRGGRIVEDVEKNLPILYIHNEKKMQTR